MTEKKVSHTPGPWSVDTTERDWPCVMAPDDWIIAEINTTHVTTLEEEISNAKLIAAAPEMLDALIGLLPENQDPAFDGQPSLYAVNRAKEAIKKATE